MSTSSTAPLPFRNAHPPGKAHLASALSAARTDGNNAVTLQKGELFSMNQPGAHAVECLRGLIWITHDNLADDIVLSAGQTHLAHNKARMIVQGLRNSEMRIHRPGEQGVPSFLGRIRYRFSALWAEVSASVGWEEGVR